MIGKINQLQKIKAKALIGGGEEKVKKQHERGKLTARERLGLLLDPDSFVELGMLAGHLAGPPGDGIITGYGKVNGRLICVYAQDATVRGGSIGLLHGRKMYKITERALEMRVPIIGLHDSPGARQVNSDELEALNKAGHTPLEVSEKGRSAVFYPVTQASGVIPQISAIMGSCSGISVYSPSLTDFIFMVDKTSHMFITGPRVVESIIGENISMEELGGAKVHASTTGLCDFRSKNEKECIEGIKKLLSFLPDNCEQIPPINNIEEESGNSDCDFSEIIPSKTNKPYDMHKIIEKIVDNGEFLEVKKEFAGEIIVGFARLGGQVLGVVANQPKVRSGSLTANGSNKEARFIRFCDCFNIPILMIVDTPAYLPGSRQEHSGIIIHGAKVLYALCEATVPRIGLVLRKSYGGGNLGMGVAPGLATDYILLWPTAERGVLGAGSSVALHYGEQAKKMADSASFLEKKQQEYQEMNAGIFEASSNLNIDLIEPRETRKYLIRAFKSLKGKKVLRVHKRQGNMPL